MQACEHVGCCQSLEDIVVYSVAWGEEGFGLELSELQKAMYEGTLVLQVLLEWTVNAKETDSQMQRPVGEIHPREERNFPAHCILLNVIPVNFEVAELPILSVVLFHLGSGKHQEQRCLLHICNVALYV